MYYGEDYYFCELINWVDIEGFEDFVGEYSVPTINRDIATKKYFIYTDKEQEERCYTFKACLPNHSFLLVKDGETIQLGVWN